jgi:uncharacterized protein (DUF1810 family)
MNDPYNLERFVSAQDHGDTYHHALDELRHGQKTSHWMWFVFPQIAGLGHSAVSQNFAIASLEEATAYLDHPILGPRLTECTRVLAETQGRSAVDILGRIDAQKLHSSMTLFRQAAPDEPLFARILDRYFDGIPDHTGLPRGSRASGS